MVGISRWKFGTAAFMMLAMTTSSVAPMFIQAPASAQLLRGDSRTVTIPAGVTFPVTYEKDKILVTSSDTTPLTVKLTKNIVDRYGNILIPKGSTITGQLEPATKDDTKGSQFIAQQLVFLGSDNQQPIDASSKVITRKEKIDQGTDTSKILTDAAIGAGAAAAISLITGKHRISTWGVLGGAGAGALASVLLRHKEVNLVKINPQDGDLNVKLRSDLTLQRY